MLIIAMCYTSKAQSIYVPDDNFEQALIDLNIDSGPLDDSVSISGILTINTLDIRNHSISDLTGIEYFENLKVLNCRSNNLTKLDLGTNLLLESLLADSNQISQIDLTNNIKLKTLHFSYNNIATLDLHTNNLLEIANISNNSITALDLGMILKVNFKELNCSDNKLEELELNKLPNLEKLHCSGNELMILKTAWIPKLQTLICNMNDLLALDLSHNKFLRILNCRSNDLIHLNLSNGSNSMLDSFDVRNNVNLTSICVDDEDSANKYFILKGNPATFTNTNCSSTVISDYNFEQKLSNLGIDKNGSTGTILNFDAQQTTKLDVSNSNIKELIGIEAFTELTHLLITGNEIQAIDISALIKLTTIDFSNNLLRELNLANNFALDSIYVTGNLLESLSSKSTNIRLLDISDNKFKALPPLNNSNIATLRVSDNPIAEFRVLDFNLEEFVANNTPIRGLDFSKNTNLKIVEVKNSNIESLNLANQNNSKLSHLDITGNPKLMIVCVDDKSFADANFLNKDKHTQFTDTDCKTVVVSDVNFENYLIDAFQDKNGFGGTISLSDAKQIKRISISNRGVKDLDGIQACDSLEYLRCDFNELPSINLTNNLRLKNLICNNSKIQILSLESSFLDTIICHSNSIRVSQFHRAPNLKFLDCRSNPIKQLNLNSSKKLVTLNCTSMQLTELDLRDCDSLKNVYCSKNTLNSIRFKQNNSIEEIFCSENRIKSLGLSSFEKLTELDASFNELINLNIQNGNNKNMTYFSSRNNPDLNFICSDDAKYANKELTYRDQHTSFAEGDCETVGITEINEIMKIYPNPAEDYLIIELEQGSIVIINQLGEVIIKGFVRGNLRINTDELPRGLYLVRITSGGEVSNQKIILQ